MVDAAMNSSDFIRSNERTYRDFFSLCPVACSVPAAVFWGGDHVLLRGGLACCQCIPLRVYVGLEPVQLGDCRIEFADEYTELSPHKRTGPGPLDLDKDKKNKIVELTRRRFPDLSAKIHILSEVARNSGHPWTGAFSAALAATLMIKTGKPTANEIKGWRDKKGWDLRADKRFTECHRLAWLFSTICHGGSSSGCLVYCGLTGSNYPIFYLTEKRYPVGARPKGKPPINVMRDGQEEHRWGSDDTWLDGHVWYTGFRLPEVCPSEIQGFPVLCGVVSSGYKADVERGVTRAAEIEEPLVKTLEEIKTLVNSLQEAGETGIAESDLARIARNPTVDTMVDAYYQPLSITAAETFYALKSLFTCGGQPESLQRLARVMLSAHGMLLGLNQGWSLGTALLAEGLRAADAAKEPDTVGLKMTGNFGGFLFFVGPRSTEFIEKFREGLNSLAQESPERDIRLVWQSEAGGLETEGLRIENNFSGHEAGTLGDNDRFGEIKCTPTYVLQRCRGNKIAELWLYPTDIELAKHEANSIYNDCNDDSPEIYVNGSAITPKQVSVLSLASAILEVLVLKREPLTKDGLRDAVNKRQGQRTPGGKETEYESERVMNVAYLVNRVLRLWQVGLLLRVSADDVSIDPDSKAHVYLVPSKTSLRSSAGPLRKSHPPSTH